MKHRPFLIILGCMILLTVQAACGLPQSSGTPTSVPVPSPTSAFGVNAEDPGFCAANLATPAKSVMIVDAVMARDVEGENMNPVDPTSEFGQTDTLHTVISIQDAPVGTRFKTVWMVVDIGDPSTCNTKVSEFEIVTEGTRNIDFKVSPEPSWPVGSYKAEIYINDALDRELPYTIQ